MIDIREHGGIYADGGGGGGGGGGEGGGGNIPDSFPGGYSHFPFIKNIGTKDIKQGDPIGVFLGVSRVPARPDVIIDSNDDGSIVVTKSGVFSFDLKNNFTFQKIPVEGMVVEWAKVNQVSFSPDSRFLTLAFAQQDYIPGGAKYYFYCESDKITSYKLVGQEEYEGEAFYYASKNEFRAISHAYGIVYKINGGTSFTRTKKPHSIKIMKLSEEAGQSRGIAGINLQDIATMLQIYNGEAYLPSGAVVSSDFKMTVDDQGSMDYMGFGAANKWWYRIQDYNIQDDEKYAFYNESFLDSLIFAAPDPKKCIFESDFGAMVRTSIPTELCDVFDANYRGIYPPGYEYNQSEDRYARPHYSQAFEKYIYGKRGMRGIAGTLYNPTVYIPRTEIYHISIDSELSRTQRHDFDMITNQNHKPLDQEIRKEVKVITNVVQATNLGSGTSSNLSSLEHRRSHRLYDEPHYSFEIGSSGMVKMHLELEFSRHAKWRGNFQIYRPVLPYVANDLIYCAYAAPISDFTKEPQMKMIATQNIQAGQWADL